MLKLILKHAQISESLSELSLPVWTPASRPLDNISTNLPFGVNPNVTEPPAHNGHRTNTD